jgi:cytochrome c oxidase assembly protein subunit 15
MRALTRICLLLVIVLVSLSAYLRLSHSGIGCADWPACYGHIGDPPAVTQPVSGQDIYQNMIEQASEPLSWATPLHRLVASVLGLLILFLFFLALWRKQNRLITLALLALTVFLAYLGLQSGSLHSPAVVMGNLGGGFLMLGLLGWLLFTRDRAENRQDLASMSAVLVVVTIFLLSSQILMGGLTSANFAATSCQTLPDCHGEWLPGAEIMQALNLTRDHQVTSMGQAIGGTERAAIHMAHRLGALVTLLLVLSTGLMAWRAGGRLRRAGVFVLLLVVLDFSVGLASVMSGLPIGLAVAHNWLAGLLLLSLLKVAALNRAEARIPPLPHLSGKSGA